MSYYQYGQNILQDVLFRGDEKTDLTGTTSDYFAQTKQYIQRSYEDILSYAPWPWGLKDPPGVLDISAEKTNTATTTNGSASVTLGTAITTSVAGWWFEVDGKEVPYRIITHVAGATTLTLDATYKETAVTAGACSLYKDEYSLASDCLKPWRAWDRNNPWRDIDIIQLGEMSSRFTSRKTSGVGPMRLTVIRGSKARISPWPLNDDITLEYEYSVKPTTDLTFDLSSTDEPILPLFDRHVIADAALVLLQLQKNDSEYTNTAQLVKNKLDLMFVTYIASGKFRRYVKAGQGIWK